LSEIYVDADACPVKQEIYRVARRYGLRVILVANSSNGLTKEEEIDLVVVDGKLDAADDWIVDHVARNDIVITADIPLAARCVKIGARVLETRGRVFTEATMGDILATRDLLTQLRSMGIDTDRPAVFKKQDRSRFLQSLDTVIRAVLAGK
jgi:uncharacterized protein YaiI (UPF0178 family)